ncbi:hypothetical protein D3C75_1086240 [compost metagenome]
MGVLAIGVKDHQGHRAVSHPGHQHQAVAGLVGEAGFCQLDVPIRLADQMVGVAETQAVVRFAKRNGLFLGCTQLGQQRVLVRGDQQFA